MNRLSQIWTLYLASRRRPGEISRTQQQRLEKLVSHAKAHSPFYRRLYQGISPSDIDLSSLKGKNIQIILIVKAAGPALDDWAIWNSPRIER